MKSNRICKHCNNTFLAENREINRGNAHYCSISCATTANNLNDFKASFNLNCKHCSSKFIAKDKDAKYCSSSCKQKNYRLKKKSGNTHDRKLEKTLKDYPCEICNWNEAPRDVHHIIPVSKNGKTHIDNLIVLCPNHHRMVHYNLFSQDYLLKVIKSRTISSSLESLLIKIRSKEQDANLVIKETIIPPVVSEPSKSVL